MLPEKRQSDLHSSEARALRQTASDGFAALQMAHLRYEHALEIVDEGVLSAEDMVNIRQQGREYAEAVTRYSNAAMEWLAFMENFNQDTTKF
jgi:hypothetical protein